MKFEHFRKLLIILSVWNYNAHSRAIESMYGSLTQHFSKEGADRFNTKLNKSGSFIFNPMYGLKSITEDETYYSAFGAFVGNNSVGQTMAGATYSGGFKDTTEHVYIGFVAGAYGQSASNFKKAGLIIEHVPQIGDTTIVPIIGLELSIKLKLTDKVYIKQNNIVTPTLYTGSMALGINY